MSFYHHRQPHPDLPAIPEEGCGSPTSSIDPSSPGAAASSSPPPPAVAVASSSPEDDNESSPLEEIDIHCGVDDDTSCSAGAESLNAHSVSSYAFTLDNVGFDEENSLVGSVVGSVVAPGYINNYGGNGNGNNNNNNALLHTPPSQYPPERISRHERNLHRETCRTLGIPCGGSSSSISAGTSLSGDESSSMSQSTTPTSAGSGGRDGGANSSDGGGSYLGTVRETSGSSASGSSSANNDCHNGEMERRRRIDAMWPWPTKAGKNNGGGKKKKRKDDDDNDANFSGYTTDSKRRWSAYADRMREAMDSFGERVEDAYQRAKAKQNSNSAASGFDTGEGRGRSATNNNGQIMKYEVPSSSSDNGEYSVPSSYDPVSGMGGGGGGEGGGERVRKRARIADVFAPRRFVSWYEGADSLSRVTVGATVTVLFLLACVVVVLASVGGNGGGGNGATVDGSSASEVSPSSSSSLVENGTPDVATVRTHRHEGKDRFEDQLLHEGDGVPGNVVGNVGVLPSEEEAAFFDAAAVQNVTTPTATPSYSPSYAPTNFPTPDPTPSPSKETATATNMTTTQMSCIDPDGKFRNTRGKYRGCVWLIKSGDGSGNNGNDNDNGETAVLRSSRLDSECGALGAGSELGSNCRRTCRAYNGCLLAPAGGGLGGGGGGADKDVSQKEDWTGTKAATERVRPAPEAETEFPTDAVRSTSAPTARPTTTEPTAEPTVGPAPEPTLKPTTTRTTTPTMSPTTKPTSDPIAATSSITQTDPAPPTTFTDTRNRERECWWLNLRNVNQKRIRREANCVKKEVRDTCPESCAEYLLSTMTTMMTAKGDQFEGEGGGDAMEGDVVEDGENDAIASTMTMHSGQITNPVEGGVEGDNEDANEEDSDVMSPPQFLRTNETSDRAPSLAVKTAPPSQQQDHEAHEIIKRYDHRHDPLPQDECYDGRGYYLNQSGRPQKCSWLVGSDDGDPTDETRRMENCGYGVGENPGGSDLGRMCKNTCGTCGL